MKFGVLRSVAAAACMVAASSANAFDVLWKNGEGGANVYRIPAICTAPDGKTLVAVCDFRKIHAGDLNSKQPIHIVCRLSHDSGKTWTEPVSTWDWPWNDSEQWAASDPSFIVDQEAKKIFLFYNVWECKKRAGVYQHWVQESSDNGKTWSKPRDITAAIKRPEWPENGFLFISSGSGVQTKDGTLLHTIVWVRKHVALFGSTDHGKTWKAVGTPCSPGDECKVVELSDGKWMINSRCSPGAREVFVSGDKGKSWEHRRDWGLLDPACNAQIMRYPVAAARPGATLKDGVPESVLLFSNCKSRGRSNLTLRTSWDDGDTWNDGVVVDPGPSAYSDMTILSDGSIGIIWEGPGYSTIRYETIPAASFLKK